MEKNVRYSLLSSNSLSGLGTVFIDGFVIIDVHLLKWTKPSAEIYICVCVCVLRTGVH